MMRKVFRLASHASSSFAVLPAFEWLILFVTLFTSKCTINTQFKSWKIILSFPLCGSEIFRLQFWLVEEKEAKTKNAVLDTITLMKTRWNTSKKCWCINWTTQHLHINAYTWCGLVKSIPCIHSISVFFSFASFFPSTWDWLCCFIACYGRKNVHTIDLESLTIHVMLRYVFVWNFFFFFSTNW